MSRNALPTAEGLWRALTRKGRLFLIAGPCVIESPSHPQRVAARLKAVTGTLGIPRIFKASYDKANRSSLGSYRGPGSEPGLEILAAVRERHAVPILTDVHEVAQVEKAARKELDKLCANQSPTVVRLLRHFLDWVWTRI